MSEDKVPTTWEEVFQHKRFTKLYEGKKTAETELEKLKGQLEKAQGEATTLKSDLKTATEKLGALEGKATDSEKLAADLATLKSQFEESQTALSQKDAQLLRVEIANAKGLPAQMAARLQGVTREELEADADGLLPLVKPSTPGNPPPTPRTPATPAFTVKQLADPKFVRENRDKIVASGDQ